MAARAALVPAATARPAARVRPLVARAAWLVSLVLAALLLPAAPAPAEAVSGAELRELAARAADEPAALDRLRRVDRVDGRPADLAAALGGASGAELRARLAALAGVVAATGGGDAAAARDEAREIVSGRRFSPPEVPGPFRGVLERLADWLAPLLDVIPALDDVVPGGRPVVWALLVLIVATVAAVLAGRSLRRRAAAPLARTAPGAAADDDPDELERRARAASARGEHELALRLGFRAGLARLARRGVVEPRPSVSTGDVVRAVHLEQFDRAAARFDEIVYGRRPAAPEDVAAADEAWAAALRDRSAA